MIGNSHRRARKAAAGPISIRAVGDAPRRPPEAAFSPLRIAIHGTDSAQSINLWVPRCGDEGISGYSFGSGCHSHGLRNCSPREYSAARRCGRAGPHPSMRKEVPADAVTPGLLLLSERLISSGTFT
jgi:hypothetical protein